jgi:hypothetical protein
VDVEARKSARRKAFPCPTCRSIWQKDKIFKLYPVPQSSSPLRGSSPILFNGEDESELEVEVAGESLYWTRLGHKCNALSKLTEGGLNHAKASKLDQQVQDLGCLFGASKNIELDLKVRTIVRTNPYAG